MQTAGVNKSAMQKSDLVERAGVMLEQADKIGCKQFVTPKVRQTGSCPINCPTFRTSKMATRS